MYMGVFGIILAAGGSTRMGEHKALLDLDGRPLLLRWVEALEAECDEVIVVLGAQAEALREVLPGHLGVVVNPDWARTGPSESLLLALEGLPENSRAVVSPVDVPPVGKGDLRSLLGVCPPAALAWKGLPGHPVFIGVSEARRVLSSGETLRSVVGRDATLVGSSSPDVLLNLNTPSEWASWRRKDPGRGADGA